MSLVWPPKAVIRGQLLKQSRRQQWQHRWFVLSAEDSCLFYATGESSSRPSKRVDLRNSRITLKQASRDGEDPDVLLVEGVNGKLLTLSSPHDEVLEVWHDRLMGVVRPQALPSSSPNLPVEFSSPDTPLSASSNYVVSGAAGTPAIPSSGPQLSERRSPVAQPPTGHLATPLPSGASASDPASAPSTVPRPPPQLGRAPDHRSRGGESGGRAQSSIFSCFDLMASAADDSPSRSPSPVRATKPRTPVHATGGLRGPSSGGSLAPGAEVGDQAEVGSDGWSRKGDGVRMRIRVQQSSREEPGLSFFQQHINPLLGFSN